MKQNNRITKSALLVLAGLGILVICGPLSIDMKGYTPVTLQSLVVVLVPMIFGWRIGGISILIYLLLGGVGIPVFAGFKGGWDVFLGPTNGFLFGFLPAGVLAGWWSAKLNPQYGRYFMVFLTAQVLILLFGVIGFAFHGISSDQILYNVQYLFPGLFLKAFVGAFLVLAVKMERSDKPTI